MSFLTLLDCPPHRLRFQERKAWQWKSVHVFGKYSPHCQKLRHGWRRDGAAQDGVRWVREIPNGLRGYGVSWGDVGWTEEKWGGLRRCGVGWGDVGWTEEMWNGLQRWGWAEEMWDRLERYGMVWGGIGWAEKIWGGLGRSGVGPVHADCQDYVAFALEECFLILRHSFWRHSPSKS